MKRNNFSNMKRIVVLGGGISGYGSAVLAKQQGFDTFLSDAGPIGERYTKILDEWDVPYEQGGHTMERILAADEVICIFSFRRLSNSVLSAPRCSFSAA